MSPFSVGELVVVRYGKRQGQKGTILRTQQTDVYEVKVEDGTVLFFSSKGLSATKTLQQREKELQFLLATSEGREELQALALRYATASGRLRPPRTSAVTYVLVHEREQGWISG
jgi:hypothetical protein